MRDVIKKEGNRGWYLGSWKRKRYWIKREGNMGQDKEGREWGMGLQ